MGNEQCNAPKSKVVKISQEDFIVYVAIDFGTDGCGIAYAFDSKYKSLTKIKETIIEHELRGAVAMDTEKIKTCILLSKDYQVQKFGSIAASYSEASMKDCLYFDNFKMKLYSDPSWETRSFTDNIPFISNNNRNGVDLNLEINDKNDEKISSDKVFIATLTHLKEQALEFLIKKCKLNINIPINNNINGGEEKNDTSEGIVECKPNSKGSNCIEYSDIQWLLTVPAIWNESAKDQMRNWAFTAFDINSETNFNQLRLVLEPDCAAIYVQNEFRQKLNFTEGQNYILVDAGGGTVDIVCHTIRGKNNFGAKEIFPAAGGPWGSKYIDEQMVELFYNLFTKEYMEEFENDVKYYYVKIMDEIHWAKLEIQMNAGHTTLPLCRELIAFLEKEHRLGPNGIVPHVTNMIKKHYRPFINSKHFYISFSEIDDRALLHIPIVIWRQMFDNCIQPIVKSCRDKLRCMKQRGLKCDYIFLCGGFAKSEYFRSQFKEFENENTFGVEIISPKNPILSVVMGAALFGINREFIKSRKLSKTYAIKVSKEKSLVLSQHLFNGYHDKNFLSDKKNSRHNCDNVLIIDNLLAVLKRKGDEILVNDQVLDIRAYGKYFRAQKDANITIYESNKTDVLTIKDGRYLCEFEITFPEEVEEILVEISFTDTLLTVWAYTDDSKSIKKLIRIQYRSEENASFKF